MRRPRTPGQMVHSVSATDLDWERVRERADAAGMSISRYLVERALTVELSRDAKGGVRPPPRLVWGEAEQREMQDRIAAIHDRVSTGSEKEDASALTQIGVAVSSLFLSAMLEMVRAGEARRMTGLLAETVGEEKAQEMASKFIEGWRKRGLLG